MNNTPNKKSTGYYKPETLHKFAAALNDAKQLVKTGADTRVRISQANSKMGAVASVSLLPFLTCPGCCAKTCGIKCYAAKLANLRPAVLRSYAINTALAILAPAEYWSQVNAAAAGVRFFRFHVSGDIMTNAYFHHIVETAENNIHTEFLVFTKAFDAVNAWLDAGKTIPENLHVLFSGWTNLKPENPHGLPETNVIPRNVSDAWYDLPEGWTLCSGNCYNCAISGAGCWNAKSGETIAFKMH